MLCHLRCIKRCQTALQPERPAAVARGRNDLKLHAGHLLKALRCAPISLHLVAWVSAFLLLRRVASFGSSSVSLMQPKLCEVLTPSMEFPRDQLPLVVNVELLRFHH